MDPYGDHVVTCKHGPHTIRRHNRMSYVENIIANEASLKSRLEKTGLIVDRKDRLANVLLPMFCTSQDAYLDSVITHPLQPTFIDHATRKSLVAAKAVADAPPTPQRTQMWAQVAAEEEGVEARSLTHNT